MNHLDLFSGLGGFALGFTRAGGQTIAFAETDKYCSRTLEQNFPGVPNYGDVANVTAERFRADGIPEPEIVSAGFPCQDISVAGDKAGIGAGTRSGLWSECSRVLREFRPRLAVFENSPNLLSGNGGRWFEQILGELSALGYDVEWHCIPAASAGARHIRDRIWIICRDAGRVGSQGRDSQRREAPAPIEDEYAWCPPRGAAISGAAIRRGLRDVARRHDWGHKTKPFLSGGNARVSNRVVRIKALGNSVIPQIPEAIYRALDE